MLGFFGMLCFIIVTKLELYKTKAIRFVLFAASGRQVLLPFITSADSLLYVKFICI